MNKMLNFSKRLLALILVLIVLVPSSLVTMASASDLSEDSLLSEDEFEDSDDTDIPEPEPELEVGENGEDEEDILSNEIKDDCDEEEENSILIDEPISDSLESLEDTFELISYEVAFYADDEKPINVVCVDEGDVCEPLMPPNDISNFIGWYELNAEDPFDFNLPITSDINLYARSSDDLLVQFQNGANKVIHSVFIKPKAVLTDEDFIEAGALVKSLEAEKIFDGSWRILGAEEEFDKDTKIIESIILEPIFIDGVTVTFITNGSIVHPQFIKPGTSATKPKDPKQTGFTFQYWSIEEGSDEAYDFTTTVDENLTLYAVWDGAEVDYQVVYWLERENIPDADFVVEDISNYEYAYSVTQKGSAGSKVSISDPTTLLDNNGQFALLQKVADASNGAPFAEHQWGDEDVVIEGDGSTVINVYYTRNLYNLKFVVKFNVGKNSGHVDVSNYLSRVDCSWPTGAETVSDSSGESVYNIEGVKIGQDISSVYPRVFNDNGDLNFKAYNKAGQPTKGSSSSDTIVRGWGPNVMSMPGILQAKQLNGNYINAYNTTTDTATYYSVWSNVAQHQTLSYTYVESLYQEAAGIPTIPNTAPVSDDPANVPYLQINDLLVRQTKNGALTSVSMGDYPVFELLSSSAHYWANNQDRQIPVVRDGFTFISIVNADLDKNCYQWDANKSKFYQLKTSASADNNNQDRRYFFYSRNSYKLELNWGGYSGALADNPKFDECKELIKFEAEVSGVIPTKEIIDKALKDAGIIDTFEGWYLDSEFKTKYNPDEEMKMPAGGLILFARFTKGTYTTTFYNEYPADEMGIVDIQVLNAGQRAAKPDAFVEGKGYEGLGIFTGWYYESRSGALIPYLFSSYYDTTMSVYAKWIQSGFTLTYDLAGGDAETPIESSTFDLNTKTQAAFIPNLTRDSNGETEYFIGWTREDDESNTLIYAGAEVSMYGHTVLVAQYAARGDCRFLTYYENHSDSDKTITFAYLLGSAATIRNFDDILLLFSNNDYDFLGWGEEFDSETNFIDSGITIIMNEDVDLYAIWDIPVKNPETKPPIRPILPEIPETPTPSPSPEIPEVSERPEPPVVELEPEPEPEIPEVSEVPEIDIEDIFDPDTPLAPGVDIDAAPVPLGPGSNNNGLVDIGELDVPLSDSPKTADGKKLGGLWAAMIASAFGALLLGRKAKEEREEENE